MSGARWQEQMDRDAWPAGFDRRAMRDESGFGSLDMPKRIAVMEQTAAILRAEKAARHEHIRAAIAGELGEQVISATFGSQP